MMMCRPRKGVLVLVTLCLLLMLQVTHAQQGWKERLLSFLVKPQETKAKTKPDDETKSIEASNVSRPEEEGSDPDPQTTPHLLPTVDTDDDTDVNVVDLTDKEEHEGYEDEEDSEDNEDVVEEDEEMLFEDEIEDDNTTTEKKKVHVPILNTIDAMLELGEYQPSQRNLKKKAEQKAKKKASIRMARSRTVRKKKKAARAIFIRRIRKHKAASQGGQTPISMVESSSSSGGRPSTSTRTSDVGGTGGFYRCQLPQEDLNCISTTITIIGTPPCGGSGSSSPGGGGGPPASPWGPPALSSPSRGAGSKSKTGKARRLQEALQSRRVLANKPGFVSADGVIILPFNHEWCINTMVYKCPNYNEDTSAFSVLIFPFSGDNPPILATSNTNRRLQDWKKQNKKSRKKQNKKSRKRGKGNKASPPSPSPPSPSPPSPSPPNPSPSPPSPSPPNPSPPNPNPPKPCPPPNPNGSTKITVTLPHGHVSCQTRCPMPFEAGGSGFPPDNWSPNQNVGFHTIGFGPPPNPNFGTANLGPIILSETHPDCLKTVFKCPMNTDEGGTTMYFQDGSSFTECVLKEHGPGNAIIIYPPLPNPNPPVPNPNPPIPNPPVPNPWGGSGSNPAPASKSKANKAGKDRRMLRSRKRKSEGLVKTEDRVPVFGTGSVPEGSSVVTVERYFYASHPTSHM
eukprot:scaffold7471_cov51-Attheya_sp.AAC.3